MVRHNLWDEKLVSSVESRPHTDLGAGRALVVMQGVHSLNSVLQTSSAHYFGFMASFPSHAATRVAQSANNLMAPNPGR